MPTRNRRPAQPDPAHPALTPTRRTPAKTGRLTKAPRSEPGIISATSSPPPAEEQPPIEPAAKAPPAEEPPKPRKVNQNMYWDAALLERTRTAAYILSGQYPEAGIGSMSEIMNIAVARYLPELEAEYNDGKQFEPLPGRGLRGRPRTR